MKFQIYQSSKDKQWRWRLRSRNGRIVAQGEGHGRKGYAIRAAKRMRQATFLADIVTLEPKARK